MSELGGDGDVQEIEVNVDELVGRTISEFRSELPENCVLALLTRDGNTSVPDEAVTLQPGDRVTLLCEAASVREAIHRNQLGE